MTTKPVRVRGRHVRGAWIALGLLTAALCLYAYSALRRVAPASSARVTGELSLEETSCFALEFARFSNAEAARVEAARYVSRGAAGYVYESDGFRVLGAGYATREEAERVANRLAETEGLPCALCEAGAPKATLIVTAEPAQIEALRSADETLRAQIERLSDAAGLLDRGGSDALAETLETFSATGKAAGKAWSELNANVGAGKGAFSDGLLDGLSRLAEACSALSQNEGGALALSSAAKAAFLDAKLAYITLRNAL